MNTFVSAIKEMNAFKLADQMAEVVKGTRGFISLPAFRQETGVEITTNGARRMAEAYGLMLYKHGKYGWCIGRP